MMTGFTKRTVLFAALSFAIWGCDADPSSPTSATRDLRATAANRTTSVGVADTDGKVWRQLVETTGLSWTQVSEVCPLDGATPCSGIVGGRDLRGWIWGTAEQVTNLLGHYEPAILTSPTV